MPERDYLTPIVLVFGLAAGVGGYLMFKKSKEKEGTSAPHIVSYQNLRTGTTVLHPGKLDAIKGDTIRVWVNYTYKGPGMSGQYHVAAWRWNLLDPHQEVDSINKPFFLPATDSPSKIEDSIDLILDSWNLVPGEYGLYFKIMSTEGADFHYYTQPAVLRVFTPSGFANLEALALPTVVMAGNTITFDVSWEYEGLAHQGGIIRCGVGNRGLFGFDEVLWAQTPFNQPESPTRQRWSMKVPVPVTSKIGPGKYDIEVKLGSISGPDLFFRQNDIIEVV